FKRKGACPNIVHIPVVLAPNGHRSQLTVRCEASGPAGVPAHITRRLFDQVDGAPLTSRAVTDREVEVAKAFFESIPNDQLVTLRAHYDMRVPNLRVVVEAGGIARPPAGRIAPTLCFHNCWE